MAQLNLTQGELQQIVDDWNDKHPVGTAVTVNRCNEKFPTRTRSGAHIEFNMPVIYVEGFNGIYPLDWITVIAPGGN